MCFGGTGTNTVTTQSGPPQAVLDQYSNIMNQANSVASQPLNQYTGNVVAGWTPQQQQAFNEVQGAQGMSAPFTNAAANYINQGTSAVNVPGMMSNSGTSDTLNAGVAQIQNAPGVSADYVNSGIGTIGQATNTIGNTGNYLGQATSAAQYNPNATSQYMSPYLNSAVASTEAEQNNQDAQQQQGVIGNAISSGAWGGDRASVAQGIMAGQQALANNQTISGMENTGYQNALQTQQQYASLGANTALGAANANTQAGAALTQAGTATANAGLGLGSQMLQAGTAGANVAENQQQQSTSAQEAQDWINQNAGNAMSGLGTTAQSNALSGANAELSSGALQQQLNQEQLNVPYEEFQQQQAYPYQTTDWLSSLATGLGSQMGGTSSTTTPGASVASQISGLGMAGLGAYNALSGSKRGGRIERRIKRDFGGGVTLPGVPNLDYGVGSGPSVMQSSMQSGMGTPSGASMMKSTGSKTTIPNAPAGVQQAGMGAVQAANDVKLGQGAAKGYNYLSNQFGGITPSAATQADLNSGLSQLSDQVGANADASISSVLNGSLPSVEFSGMGADALGTAAETAGESAATDAGISAAADSTIAEIAPELLDFAFLAQRGGRIKRAIGGGAPTLSAPPQVNTGIFAPAANAYNSDGSVNTQSYGDYGYNGQALPSATYNPNAKTTTGSAPVLDQAGKPAAGTPIAGMGASGMSTSGIPQVNTGIFAPAANVYNSNGSVNTQSYGDYGYNGQPLPSATYTPPVSLGTPAVDPTTTATAAGAAYRGKSARGGRTMGAMGSVPRFQRDAGGGLNSGGLNSDVGALSAGVPDASGAAPIQMDLTNQFAKMSPEQLRELSVRMPPTSAQGQALQKVLQAKTINPGFQSQQQQSGMGAPGMNAPAMMARGGRAGFDLGGADDSDNDNATMDASPDVPAAINIKRYGAPSPWSTTGVINRVVNADYSPHNYSADANAPTGFAQKPGYYQPTPLNAGDLNAPDGLDLPDNIGPTIVVRGNDVKTIPGNDSQAPTAGMAAPDPTAWQPPDGFVPDDPNARVAAPDPTAWQPPDGFVPDDPNARVAKTKPPTAGMAAPSSPAPPPKPSTANLGQKAPPVLSLAALTPGTTPSTPGASSSTVPSADYIDNMDDLKAKNPDLYNRTMNSHQQTLDSDKTGDKGTSKFLDSPWAALMNAGLAMAAGRSPNALTNVATGLQAGVGSLQKQREQQEKQSQADQDRVVKNNQITAANFDADQKAIQFYDNLQRYKAEDARSSRTLADTEAAQAAKAAQEAELQPLRKKVLQQSIISGQQDIDENNETNYSDYALSADGKSVLAKDDYGKIVNMGAYDPAKFPDLKTTDQSQHANWTPVYDKQTNAILGYSNKNDPSGRVVPADQMNLPKAMQNPTLKRVADGRWTDAAYDYTYDPNHGYIARSKANPKQMFVVQ